MTCTRRPDDVLADLDRQLAALGDIGDVPNTPHAHEQFAARQSALANRRQAIRMALAAQADLAPKIATLQTWHDDLTAIRQQIGVEFRHAPRPRTDRDYGRFLNLQMSISCIDRGPEVARDSGWSLETLRVGELLRERGYVAGTPIENQAMGLLPWLGALPNVERRLAELQKEYANTERRLAEALLDDDERERQAAERRKAAAAIPVRKTRGDGSQFDEYADGRVVEVEPVATS